MHVIAGKAVCFKEALKPEFKDYARQIVKNSQAMAETLIEEGLDLVSGGTDNHLILLDLTNLGITGLEAENALGDAGITVNKNTIPRETRSPFVTSGLRIGTPAITSRGMKEDEMKQIAHFIAHVLKDTENVQKKAEVKAEVKTLASGYPLYPDAVC